MSFTDKYPLEPPEILFLEPSPVHPHIYRSAPSASQQRQLSHWLPHGCQTLTLTKLGQDVISFTLPAILQFD